MACRPTTKVVSTKPTAGSFPRGAIPRARIKSGQLSFPAIARSAEASEFARSRADISPVLSDPPAPARLCRHCAPPRVAPLGPPMRPPQDPQDPHTRSSIILATRRAQKQREGTFYPRLQTCIARCRCFLSSSLRPLSRTPPSAFNRSATPKAVSTIDSAQYPIPRGPG